MSEKHAGSVLEPQVAGTNEAEEHYVNERGADLLKEHQGRRARRRRKVEERLRDASQTKLVWSRFKKHRLATISLVLLIVVYGVALFAEFVAPYDKLERFPNTQFATPSQIHVVDQRGDWHMPFIYQTELKLDPDTFTYKQVVPDNAQRFPVEFFVQTDDYRLAGVVPLDVRLFGTTDGPPLMLLGGDQLGRDLFSRLIYASRVSLLVGLGGVFVSFILGVTLGGISGYFGGKIDAAIQRTIDFIISIPLIPLWMALSAAIPRDWSGIQTYFAITIILSLVGWTGLARVVRGKVISLREEDYVTAARISSASHASIIRRHLLPGVTSFLVVHITLAIPGMILGETTLSFLGLGITAPDVSWGTLLQQAQDVTVVANYPWLLTPALALVFAVVLFNFVGDGLRDAADPYSR
jgi:peptide/nickel transport system permease protein